MSRWRPHAAFCRKLRHSFSWEGSLKDFSRRMECSAKKPIRRCSMPMALILWYCVTQICRSCWMDVRLVPCFPIFSFSSASAFCSWWMRRSLLRSRNSLTLSRRHSLVREVYMAT